MSAINSPFGASPAFFSTRLRNLCSSFFFPFLRRASFLSRFALALRALPPITRSPKPPSRDTDFPFLGSGSLIPDSGPRISASNPRISDFEFTTFALLLFPLVKSQIRPKIRRNFNRLIVFRNNHVFIKIGFVCIIYLNICTETHEPRHPFPADSRLPRSATTGSAARRSSIHRVGTSSLVTLPWSFAFLFFLDTSSPR